MKWVPNPEYLTARYEAVLIPIETLMQLKEDTDVRTLPHIPYPFLPLRFNRQEDGSFVVVPSHLPVEQ